VKSLIIVAHGSRRPASNSDVHTLTNKLRHKLGRRFNYVQCAFLEFAQPSIPAAIDAAVHACSTDIVILPYFLSCGTHTAEHIPMLVAAKQAEYAAVTIDLKPYIGAAPGMIELLASAV
jgi:sirohydrochlorin ferrochelatase